MSNYDQFKFEQAVVAQLYSEQHGDLRKPFESYGYWDYLKSRFLGFCCSQSAQHNKFMKAQKMLDEEMDILLIVKQMRLLRSMAAEKFSRRQILNIVNYSDLSVISADPEAPIDLSGVLGVPMKETSTR